MRTELLNQPRAMLGAASGAGVLAGAVAWLLFGTGSAELRRLESDQTQLRSLHLSTRPAQAIDSLIATAIGRPLFALTTGPGAQSEPTISITGVARTPFRRAALVSVNGGPPAWLAAGQSSGPVSVVDVQPPKVVVETPFGRKEVYLGEGAAVAPPTTAPAGVRMPPAPADAPTPP